MFKVCVSCRCLMDIAEFNLRLDGFTGLECRDCINQRKVRNRCHHMKSKYQCGICSPHLKCACGKQRHQCKSCDLYRYVEQIVRIHNRRVCHTSARYMENLGCPIGCFIQWIEAGFTDEMNWDNWGTLWELDHTLPLYQGDYQEQVRRLHFTNVLPKLKIENRPGRPTSVN